MRREKIIMLENAILVKNKFLIVKTKTIAKLKDAILRKYKVVNIKSNISIYWAANNIYIKVVDVFLKEKANIEIYN